MSAEVFIDSNIWLYAFLKNPGEAVKQERARSLIVGSALEAGCITLLTEDMQHGQRVADQITIINPFLEASE